MTELVVDANVLAHSGNPANRYFDSALEIIIGLVESDDLLALDDTGKDAPNAATSNLYREYVESISPVSLAASVLATLLSGERVNFYPRPGRQTWTKCKQLVPRNNNDAIVIGIGACTGDNIVISNDFADFPVRVRSQTKKTLGVTILCSDEFAA